MNDLLLQYEDLQLDKVCSICLIKQEKIRFISSLVLEMLMECASIQLPPDENILICDLCESEITKWHSFKQQVLKSFEIIKLLSENRTVNLNIEEEIDNNNVMIPKKNTRQLKEHKCDRCSEIFKTHGQLRTHYMIHKIEEGFKCDYCDKSFNSARSLWGHKRRHCEIKPFPCSECDKTFPFKHALDRHFQARHSTSNNFLCSYCPKLYKVKETLAAHVKKKHSDESGSAVCNICGKQCGSLAVLKVHLRSHTGERPFICEFCSKGFVTNDHLTLHRRIHTGERPYKCSDCKRGFISSSVLRKHKRTHTGERPYKCHLCNKNFSLRSAFKSHLKSH